MFHTTPDVIEDGETTSYNPLCLLAETDSSFCAYLVLQLYVVAFLSHSQYTFDAAVVNPRLYGHFYVQSPFQLPICKILFPYESCTFIHSFSRVAEQASGKRQKFELSQRSWCDARTRHHLHVQLNRWWGSGFTNSKTMLACISVSTHFLSLSGSDLRSSRREEVIVCFGRGEFSVNILGIILSAFVLRARRSAFTVFLTRTCIHALLHHELLGQSYTKSDQLLSSDQWKFRFFVALIRQRAVFTKQSPELLFCVTLATRSKHSVHTWACQSQLTKANGRLTAVK